MSINMKQDVSYLFSNLNNKSSNVMDMSFLSDYASIKNGSYGKLVKAYYSKVGSDESSKTESKDDKLNTSLSADSSKKLAEVKSSADSLREVASKLTATGKDSIFEMKETVKEKEDGTKETVSELDMDVIYRAVSDFVSGYNELVKNSHDSEASGVTSALENMTGITSFYKKNLEDIGISINKEGSLTIDEKAFMSADADKVKKLFNGSNSFASTVISQASFIGSAAIREAGRSNTYTGSGTFSNNYTTGDLFSSLF